MAKFKRRVIDPAGRPLYGASVYVYTEDAAKQTGDFTSSHLATVYSDEDLATTVTQPLTVGQDGCVEFFMPSMSQIAIHTVRSSWGSAWERFVDVTGSDNA